MLVSSRVEIEHQVPFTKLDYCQYLLSTQKNYTLTNIIRVLMDSWYAAHKLMASTLKTR